MNIFAFQNIWIFNFLCDVFFPHRIKIYLDEKNTWNLTFDEFLQTFVSLNLHLLKENLQFQTVFLH